MSILRSDRVMNRLWFAVPFVLLGSAAIAWGLLREGAPPFANVLLDLGVETIGLALTVAVVDWYLERRRLQAAGRRLAWHTFHAIERIVWVWQGGPPRLDTGEVLSLLQDADRQGEVAQGTESLLLGLAVESRRLLKADKDAVEALSGLEGCLGDLTLFANVAHEGRTPSVGSIISTLLDVTKRLAKLLDLSADSVVPARLIRARDPSLEAQASRARVAREVIGLS